MIKKVIAILLVITLSFTLFSCDRGGEKPPETEEYILPTEIVDADISLPYTSADSFDPYTAKSSINKDLTAVIFESLYVPTADGKGEKLLAADGNIKGDKVTVKLIEGVKFSDGVEVNSAYVKTSLEKAKNNPYFSSSLANIKSVTVADNLTVVFNLFRADAFALNVLNFPIIRTSDSKTVGTGKYKIQYLEEVPYLQVNMLHRDYKDSWNKQIALYDMAGISSPIYPFKANEISVYRHDLSKTKYINLSSKTVSQSMNNLVYVGANSKWAGSLTSLLWVRQAINIGISRSGIAASSFLGQADPVVTPYKSGFYQLEHKDLPDVAGETEKAIAILERNGFDKVNEEGIRTNGNISLRINILVCTENEYKITVAEAVRDSLKDLGFGVTITEKKTMESFVSALKEGHYGLYVGEIQLPYNYDLSEFFSEKGELNYGISPDFYAEYGNYEKGTSSTKAFVEAFETQVPFIPLFYRKAVLSINPNVVGVNSEKPYSSVSDWKIQKQ